MQDYKIKLTWEAIYDATDIADYIELSFGIARSDKFQADLKKEIERLKFIGSSFMRTHILYRGYSIHKKTFSPSIIFYIIDEKMKEIYILRILRDAQDWENILKGKEEYTEFTELP